MAEQKSQASPEIPPRMRAAVAVGYGSADEVVEVQEVDTPEPREGQVLVQVYAASVNPADNKTIAGNYRLQGELNFPKIVGYNVSGVIVKVGEGVNKHQWYVGAEILGQTPISARGRGCMAEYAIVEVTSMWIKPQSINWIEAAAIPCVSCTSYQALTTHGQLAEGQKVLILGGTTSTGMTAIQMAKMLKASLIAVTSRDEPLCKELGANTVINYRESDWWTELKDVKFDVIYDCVGGYDSWEKAQSMMVNGGRYVTIVGDDPHMELSYGVVASLMASRFNRGFWWMFGYPSYSMFLQDMTQSYTDYMPGYADGTFRIVIDERSPYTFDNIKDMFRDSLSGRAKGKLVLQIRE